MSNAQPSSLLPVSIIATLFFVFGFITWLNGALVPFLQLLCELTETQAILIASTFYFAYVVMALPMASLIERVGYKSAMSIGLVIIGVGCLGYIPAANTQAFSLFLASQFVLGSGLTLLQAASNPYVVKVGPEETAAVRIAFMGILNKFAGVCAPLLFSAWVLGGFAGINAQSMATMSEAERWATQQNMADGLLFPYLGMALVLMALAAGLRQLPLPELTLPKAATPQASKDSIWRYPHLLCGVIALFCYVGVEVIAGDTIGLMGSKLGVANPSSLTSLTMASMVCGYLVGLLAIPRWVSQARALAVSALLGLALTLAIVLLPAQAFDIAQYMYGWTGASLLPNSIVLIALLGFANAMVWPTVWPLALADLQHFTAKGSAMLIMAIAGGAVLPLLYAVVAETVGGQHAYAVMLPCYLFILFYALVGHRLRSRG